MSVKNRNYQWLSIVLLSLVFTGLNGCGSDPETATARLKVLSEDMSADDITEIRALIKAGADVNVKGTDGRTALWLAAWKGHGEIVKLLLESKADVNAANIYSATALIVASQNGHTEIIKALLEAKADVNAKAHLDGKDYTPLSIAKMMGRAEVIKFLKEYGAKD